jgi:hypothetical protein
VAIEELQDWAYTGNRLVPLKGYPGIVGNARNRAGARATLMTLSSSTGASRPRVPVSFGEGILRPQDLDLLGQMSPVLCRFLDAGNNEALGALSCQASKNLHMSGKTEGEGRGTAPLRPRFRQQRNCPAGSASSGVHGRLKRDRVPQ